MNRLLERDINSLEVYYESIEPLINELLEDLNNISLIVIKLRREKKQVMKEINRLKRSRA